MGRKHTPDIFPYAQQHLPGRSTEQHVLKFGRVNATTGGLYKQERHVVATAVEDDKLRASFLETNTWGQIGLQAATVFHSCAAWVYGGYLSICNKMGWQWKGTFVVVEPIL